MSLIIISGAGGSIGNKYLEYLSRDNSNSCVGLSRNKDYNRVRGVKYFHIELIDKSQIKKVISNISLHGFKKIIFIHCVGKFKFEKESSCRTVDSEVYKSNVDTFINFAEILLNRVSKDTEIIMCALGSISDKYNIPFWQSFSQAKNDLRSYLKKVVNKFDNVRAIFVNISSTDTKQENKLRPHADKRYWLSPEEVVQRSLPAILDPKEKWREIDIYKPDPSFNNYYKDLKRIQNKWQKEMGNNDKRRS